MIRVGIPQALLYYQYYPMWQAFFQALGAEVVVSPPTARPAVEAGLARMVAETCLPVKVYCGHVRHLRELGVDCVFVPAIRATEPGLFNCSKFLGLPDLIRATVEDCPPLLEIDIDVGQGRGALRRAIYHLGRPFTWSPLHIRKAALAAWEAHLGYQALMRERKLTPPEAIEGSGGEGHALDSRCLPDTGSLVIAVVGHPYCLYDSYINHDLLSRLRRMGVRVITPEMAPAQGLEMGIRRLACFKYWVYEAEVTGAAGYYLEDPSVNGVIAVVVFGCGPDSTMLDVVQRAARRQEKPYMGLVLDEHTGEAGLVTRLEAFVDMITRRRVAGRPRVVGGTEETRGCA